MARARTAVVAIALLVAVAAIWVLLARNPDGNLAAPPDRKEPLTPVAPVLEGRAATESDPVRTRARLAEDQGVPATPVAEGVKEQATIEGTVTGWDGKPMAGLEMYLVLADEPAPPRMKGGQWRIDETKPNAKTDANGYYVARSPPKDWTGVVVARVSSTYEVRSAPIRVDGARQRVDFVLPPPATLRVRLVSTKRGVRLKQLNVEGEHVWFSFAREEDDPWVFREEEEGSVVTVRCTPGRATVRGWIEDGPMVARETELVSGQTVEVELVAPEDGVVRGRLLHPAEWRLLYASLMWDGDRTIFADVGEDGEFRLAGTGRGRGRLHVEAYTEPGGHFDIDVEGVLPDSGIVEVRLEQRPPAVLAGHVSGVPGVATLEGMLLSRRLTQGGWRVPLDEHGRFEVPLRLKEPSLAVLNVAGMAPVLIDVPLLAPGERRDVGVLQVGPGIELVGRVRNVDDLPVAGVEVAVAERWAKENHVPAVTTDEHGGFRIPHMPDRPLLLRFRGGGFPQHLVSVDPAKTPKPEVVLKPGGFVSLHVVDTEGRGVAGAAVAAFPVGDFPYDGDLDTMSRSLKVDTTGKVRSRICAGPRRWRAYAADGRKSEDVVATFREGETTEVTLVLREKSAK